MKCLLCNKKAVWWYMPGEEDHCYCDDCVPRGCSCNIEPVDGNYDNRDPNNWREIRDEQGRLYPCCEFWYIED